MYEIQGETVKHLFRTKFGVQIVHQEPVETSLSKAAEEFDSSEDKEEIEVKPIRKGEKSEETIHALAEVVKIQKLLYEQS